MSPRRRKLCRQARIDFAWSLAIGVLPYLLALLVVLATDIRPARGQEPPRRETHTTAPELDGIRAHAPVAIRYHVRNEGGSDHQGLCVISSILANGMSQGVPGLDVPGHDERSGRQMPGKGSPLWRAAKSRPGGYSPTKLQGVLNEVMPGEKWASYVGTDHSVLDRLSRAGYPIGATMNTGELYKYNPIHHMVSLNHFDSRRDLAMVVDNNEPGVFTWMSAREYKRRWIDQGTGWAFVWLRRTARSPATIPAAVVVGLPGLAAIIGALAIRLARAASADGETTKSDSDGYPYEWA